MTTMQTLEANLKLVNCERSLFGEEKSNNC